MRAAACGLVLVLAACAAPRAEDSYTELYHRLHPSVVFFTMKIPADDPKRKGKWDEAYGTGFVVESGAWGSRILTDAHVIDEARELVAVVGDGQKAAAHVVARSNDNDDVAIVETAIPNVPPVTIGSAHDLAPGEPIGVLGYPIPDAFEDEHLGRTVSLYVGRIASIRKGSLELDVPIIPGESGGPVFDGETGAVIGLAESRFDEERAIGFATPIDIATAFLNKHPRR